MTNFTKAAIIGGGVIGGGWVARFALNGIDVSVFDPDPEAPRKIGEVYANAERAMRTMCVAPLPTPGKITYASSIAEAVEGVQWIQESVSEVLALKHKVYAEIQAAAPDTLLGSSTSGFKPSELQQGAVNPASILVAHPFNPVYLIRFGFGLRWAQMGLFETYRVAGGEAGMKHFMAQFGPCLTFPWTKLMDVPEFTDELVDLIAGQSDAQSGHPEWVDYNGHMTEFRYLHVFGDATDAFLTHIGMDSEYMAKDRSIYTVESHIRHIQEVAAGKPLALETQLLGYDEWKILSPDASPKYGTAGTKTSPPRILRAAPFGKSSAAA